MSGKAMEKKQLSKGRGENNRQNELKYLGRPHNEVSCKPRRRKSKFFGLSGERMF